MHFWLPISDSNDNIPGEQDELPNILAMVASVACKLGRIPLTCVVVAQP